MSVYYRHTGASGNQILAHPSMLYTSVMLTIHPYYQVLALLDNGGHMDTIQHMEREKILTSVESKRTT